MNYVMEFATETSLLHTFYEFFLFCSMSRHLPITRFIKVQDNFYADPDKVRAHALQLEFEEQKYLTGYVSQDYYHEKGVQKRLEKIIGIKINRWDVKKHEKNGVFYFGYASGKYKEIPAVHTDNPSTDVTIVIYLTPGLGHEYGTSFWQHKETGLTQAPTAADARKLKMTLSDLNDLLNDNGPVRSKWIETDRISYQYNRLIAFPSGVFHSASKHFGSKTTDGRVFQTYRVGVDWGSLG
jgi:Family of unknown function (DUF6445)